MYRWTLKIQRWGFLAESCRTEPEISMFVHFTARWCVAPRRGQRSWPRWWTRWTWSNRSCRRPWRRISSRWSSLSPRRRCAICPWWLAIPSKWPTVPGVSRSNCGGKLFRLDLLTRRRKNHVQWSETSKQFVALSLDGSYRRKLENKREERGFSSLALQMSNCVVESVNFWPEKRLICTWKCSRDFGPSSKFVKLHSLGRVQNEHCLQWHRGRTCNFPGIRN